MRPTVLYTLVAAGLVMGSLVLRSPAISEWGFLNPDEAALLTWARAARDSPVPFSTWETGTTGPVGPLVLAGLSGLGAPLTLAFAHLLSAVLLALIAFGLFVAASRAIGRGPAFVAIMVWWFPIAITYPLGGRADFDALSTEYFPVSLIVASALVPRGQLVARPWLFAIVGVLAGLAVGAKYQAAPLAVAWFAAQLIALRPGVKRAAVAVLWWLVGAALPAAVVMLVMLASSATNWSLVAQELSFLTAYAGGPSQLQKVASTLHALITPKYYLLVGLAGLIWLGRHSDRSSNVARIVLVAGGFTAVLMGGMGFAHYLILLFGAGGLAVTMPVKPGASLVPRRVAPRLVIGGVAVALMVALVNGWVIDKGRAASPHRVLAAFSPDSVESNPTMARVCPARSKVVVWGWAAQLYIAQDWQSTIPYVTAYFLTPDNKRTAEAVVRSGIEGADCVVEATSMKLCPPTTCNTTMPPEFALARFYPELAELVSTRFQSVPINDCDGCSLYVRNKPS
ncbi:MAG: hypothetical protein JO236_09535 [Mycobacterium sp.]|uniref:hypothetical protein n=1 Tax=Mycobacterium sp. TaxID=1785 RepID=UPI001EC7205D|nr:hypothetical protein [Mycobacterium sp.]MBW0017769.1 hypothetical protein [Mycobacterium sp.]